MKQTEDKLKYLQKLLNVYIKFFKHYNKVKLTYNNKFFIVKYYGRKSPMSYEFKEEEIPMEDIDRYIISIRMKIAYNFSKRASNKYIK